jgi:mono/diheme cytochrome c family protein
MPSAATPVAQPSPVETADGRTLYKKNCAACHRENGEGGKMEFEGKQISPENLIANKFKRASDEKIESYIRDGVEDEGMPAFEGKLSNGEIKAIIRFIRTDLQKMPMPQR